MTLLFVTLNVWDCDWYSMSRISVWDRRGPLCPGSCRCDLRTPATGRGCGMRGFWAVMAGSTGNLLTAQKSPPTLKFCTADQKSGRSHRWLWSLKIKSHLVTIWSCACSMQTYLASTFFKGIRCPCLLSGGIHVCICMKKYLIDKKINGIMVPVLSV